MDGAEFAGLRDGSRFLEEIVAAPLRPDLHHALGAAHRLDHAEAVLDGVGHGLFHVDVFAGLDRIDGHLGVPVVRRGDENGLEGFILQQLLVVVVGLSAGGGEFKPGLKAGLVDVAHRAHLEADLFPLRDMIAPAPAAPDDPGTRHVVGAQNPRSRSRRSGQKRSALHKG